VSINSRSNSTLLKTESDPKSSEAPSHTRLGTLEGTNPRGTNV